MTIIYAENNLYPSVLIEETAVGGIATLPPVGARRLIVNPSDHLLYLVDPSGVATLVGGSGGVAAGGSTGQALIKASGADFDTTWGGTSVGLALLEAASQAGGRTALGLGTAATSASSAFDAAGAAAAAQSASQPLDSDLTAIAAIAPTNNDIIQRKAGAWTNRTIAQLLTDLGVSPLTVEEVDASPTDAAITKIVFPNGTLTIVGHVATYTPTGGGGAAGLIGSKTHSTGSDAAWATITSTTSVAIDATNAACAVTVPASGKVLVTVDLDVGFSYGSFPFANFLTLMSGSTELAAAPINWFTNVTTNAIYTAVGGRIHETFLLSGLTPGAMTIKVGMRSTETQMAYANDAAGGSGHRAGPFVMAVWDAT